MTTLNFINGKAEIKQGRKVIAKVFDRAVFFKGTRYEGIHKQFPFSVEMMGGMFECVSLDEAITILNKYM